MKEKSGKENHCTISLIEKEIRFVVTRGGGGGWGWRNWMKGVRRDKFPAVQYVSSGAVTCNTRTIVSHAAGVFVSL